MECVETVLIWKVWLQFMAQGCPIKKRNSIHISLYRPIVNLGTGRQNLALVWPLLRGCT
jgi:hypothetical protein